MKKKIMVTSALPYVNGLPHLGHISGCLLPADIFNRFQRSIGNDSIYICGTDDHGTAAAISAKEVGLSTIDFVTKMNEKFKQILNKLNIKLDIFSKTSTDVHRDVTSDFYKKVKENGYIEEKSSTMLFCEHDKVGLADRFVIGTCPYCGYEKAYGDQCDNCGKTYNPDELINPIYTFCGNPAVKKETNYIVLIRLSL